MTRKKCRNNNVQEENNQCLRVSSKNSEKEFRKNEIYKCYLNGTLYGTGNLNYMHELFRDYVVTCKMYGKDECEFKIVKFN